ncbi:UDP-N-acetylenolpyruvoylglucosamine reductase [Planctomycetales bacterium]|nr:UDP-N-acetylenolpyruvoylglucosamine reductase [Planctomycetales bacterium]
MQIAKPESIYKTFLSFRINEEWMFLNFMSLTSAFSFVRSDVLLSMYTRLQLGGKAEFFAEPENESELIALLQYCHREQIPVHILGTGANVLVPDEGVAGLVIVLSRPEFSRITVNGNTLTAGGGTKFGQVVTQSVVLGLGGIENLIGIPGTFGGVLAGNAGTHSGEDIGQRVVSVRVADFAGKIDAIPAKDITFTYRDSSLDNVVILSATLCLEMEDAAELSKTMQKLWIIKKTQQPNGEMPSVFPFKNVSDGASASDLIDRAGLKGAKVGGAGISRRNAGFILVEPDCISADVVRLISLVKNEVAEISEVELESTLQIW